MIGDGSRSGQWKGEARIVTVSGWCCVLSSQCPKTMREVDCGSGGQIVTVSGWCVFSPASVRRQCSKWTVGRGRRRSSLCLDGASSLQPVSGDSARSGLWKGGYRHCVWMVRVLSSQCPKTMREVDSGRAGRLPWRDRTTPCFGALVDKDRVTRSCRVEGPCNATFAV